LMYSANESGTRLDIIEAAHQVNVKQINRFIYNIINRFGNDISGKKLALWGLAFKPNTDDTREAPSFKIIEALLEAGAQLSVYDPEAMDNARLQFNDSIKYAENMYECLDCCDALIIATEWNVFRNPDFKEVKSRLNNPLIFDGRNLFEFEEMIKLGIEYYCIGRTGITDNHNNYNKS